MPGRCLSIPRSPPQQISLPLGRRTSVSDYEARFPPARTAQQAPLSLPDTTVSLHGLVLAIGHTMRIGSLRTSPTWCVDTMHANFNLRVRRVRLPARTLRYVPRSAIGIPAMLTKVCSGIGRSSTSPHEECRRQVCRFVDHFRVQRLLNEGVPCASASANELRASQVSRPKNDPGVCRTFAAPRATGTHAVVALSAVAAVISASGIVRSPRAKSSIAVLSPRLEFKTARRVHSRRAVSV